MELVNSFKKYLVAIVPEMVYKSVTEAEKHETTSSRLAGDQYVEAKLKTGDFASIRNGTISVSVLNQVGITDQYMIDLINKDKLVIPNELQDTVLELHRKEIINNYEEQNDYYRMLYGLPGKDTSYIYLSPSELNSYGYYKDKHEDYDNDNLDKLTPLHKLPQNVLNIMETSGVLKEIYEEYSSKSGYNAEYIKYLGSKKIEPLVSRMAGQYELLYVPTVDSASRFTRDFKIYYEEARQYFLNQIYNYHFNSEYGFYEGYIGFFILVMAVQRTINSLFEVVVQRDFYDIETCRTFLSAYGVPFISTFTFNQQLALVKNLNILLMEKCTTTVLYDLLDILGYERYNITKYLLVKQHKTEQIGDTVEVKPVFVYKTTLTNEGVPIYELDKSEMYDYYFIARDVKDNDTTLVEEPAPEAYSYKSLTEDDVYWIEDSELIDKLQEDEINFVETKYAGISAVIRMYEVLFEHIYLQKMICDKGSETSNIKVDLPLITNHDVSLLDMEVLLICLLCKYNNVSPDLLVSPSKELSVLGFNFDADLEAIKNDVLSHPDIYSKELSKYILNITFNTVSDVNEMYGDVKKLRDILVECMETTTSPKVYHAYKKLYNTLLITDVHNEVFSLGDGSIPETYIDWLEENNYPLYEFIIDLGHDEILDKINYITTKMISWFTNCKYLDYLNPMDDSVIDGILKILRWFKSYTIDIKKLDVVYLFDSKYYNLMKLMSQMYFHANEIIRETDIGYNDWVNSISANIEKFEKDNTLSDAMQFTDHSTLKDYDKVLYDKLSKTTASEVIKETDIGYSDILSSISAYISKSETKNKLSEFVKYSSTLRINEMRSIIRDSAKKSLLSMESFDKKTYCDKMINNICNSTIKEKMKMRDSISFFYSD